MRPFYLFPLQFITKGLDFHSEDKQPRAIEEFWGDQGHTPVGQEGWSEGGSKAEVAAGILLENLAGSEWLGLALWSRLSQPDWNP